MFTKGLVSAGNIKNFLVTFDIQYIGNIAGVADDTSWQEFSFTNIGSHVNKTARLLILFQSSSNPSADLCLDSIQLGTTVWNFDSDTNGFENPDTPDGFRISNAATNASGVFSEYNSKTFEAMPTTSTTREIFNRRSGTTPSSNTGADSAFSGSHYVYAETSGNGRRNDFYFRSPLITVASNYVRVYAFRKADIRENQSAYSDPVGDTFLYLIYQSS